MLRGERAEHIFGPVERTGVAPIWRKCPQLGDRAGVLEFSQPECVGGKHHFEMMQRPACLAGDFSLQGALMLEIGEDGRGPVGKDLIVALKGLHSTVLEIGDPSFNLGKPLRLTLICLHRFSGGDLQCAVACGCRPQRLIDVTALMIAPGSGQRRESCSNKFEKRFGHGG
ncbi:MAG TPA: hypothetical protein VL492_02840 [Methylovirgula sp.]|nr:hypothetical protein [Methylovirgula sp.]